MKLDNQQPRYELSSIDPVAMRWLYGEDSGSEISVAERSDTILNYRKDELNEIFYRMSRRSE